MLINVMLIKKRTCTSNSFVALPRLQTTAVESGRLEQKGKVAKFSEINKRGVLNKVGEGSEKWNN